MKTIYYLLVLIFGFVISVYSQAPEISWTQTFGGTEMDLINSVQQTTDGGYITTGFTKSFGAGDYDVYLIKTDASGAEQWSKTFGGTDWDKGRSVQQTTDDGYVIAGYTKSFGAGSYDVYLIKTDASGTEQWSKTYGGINGDEGSSVQQTTDGGYIISGRTFSFGAGQTDCYLIKTDSSGTELWSKTFGGDDDEWCRSVQQTLDGGYILTGNTGYAPLDFDIFVTKTDASGIEQWSQTFGGIAYDISYKVQQTSDGGYVICGYTSSFGAGAGDVYLIKTDTSGFEQWSETYGKTEWEAGYDVQQTSDGGYIIVGQTQSSGAGVEDVYLIKTDITGTELWSQTFGGIDEDIGRSIQQTSDGGYIIAGWTYSFGIGDADALLIKIDADLTGIGQENSNIFPSYHNLLKNYPNPFNSSTTISYSILEKSRVELSIFNNKGQKIKSLLNDYVSAGEHSIDWNGDDDNNKLVSSGVYLYKLMVNGKPEAVKKCLLLK